MKTYIGYRFSMLVVLKDAESHTQPSGAKYRKVLCLCDCGNEKSIAISSLLVKSTKSCGCLRNIGNNIKHSMSITSEYKIYFGIKKGCYNTKDKAYKNYGGRGIAMCGRWLESFENFYADMGKRPSPQHSIERRDNNLGYTPDNCYWATRTEQARNTRRNVFITYNNETLCSTDMAKKYGINDNTLSSRIKNGWSIEKALTKIK